MTQQQTPVRRGSAVRRVAVAFGVVLGLYLIGQASGTLNMLRQLGAVFGVAICAAVFAASGRYGSPTSFVAGFGPAMGACAGLALLGAAAGLVIPGRRAAAPAPSPEPVPTPSKIEIRS